MHEWGGGGGADIDYTDSTHQVSMYFNKGHHIDNMCVPQTDRYIHTIIKLLWTPGKRIYADVFYHN